MHNQALQRELEAHERYCTAPLCLWRTLSAEEFGRSIDVVEAAVASIAAVSCLTPPVLVHEMTMAIDEERAIVWNEIATQFLTRDRMQLGLCAEIAGSAAALSAHLFNPVGLVTLLNLLSQPYTTMNPETRLATAATWLGLRGVILNRASMADVDWYDRGSGHPQPGYDPEADIE